MLKSMRLVGTTAVGGAATIVGNSVVGKLYAVQWIDGDLEDGVGFTLSVTNSDAPTATLLTVAAANEDKMYYPRELVHKTEDGAALTGTSGGDRALPVIAGTPQLAITAGGDAKTGGAILFWEE